MRTRTMVSVVGLTVSAMLAMVLLLVSGGTTGEYHAGGTLLCYDCHTMHFSMQHGFGGQAGPAPSTPQAGGFWLGTTGPNEFLLKAPANQLCMACHEGQTFAPDVVGVNANTSPSQGRQAGALNETGLGAPYDTWKGHTLGSTDLPPGYNPARLGGLYVYDNTVGLECTHCHTQHGQATVYRNLGPRALGSANLPNYVIGTANVTTQDVWINIAAPYTAGTGNAANFNPYYDRANISFNRNDRTLGITNSSNRIDTMCAACHGDFHGSPGDANIGVSAGTSNLEAFLRHPTSKAVIGAAGGAGYGGHSSLTRFVANTTKVKVYANDRAAWTDATPGCVTCHKGHGNQNPFGLIFLNRNATSVDEQGGYAGGQTQDLATGYRNLCGQCHGQGN